MKIYGNSSDYDSEFKRREDRKFALLGHLLSPQIDVEQHHIDFFEAHDGQNYDSPELLSKRR